MKFKKTLKHKYSMHNSPRKRDTMWGVFFFFWLRFNLVFKNNLTTKGSFHFTLGKMMATWSKIESSVMQYFLHFLIYCLYRSQTIRCHVSRRIVCHSKGLTWFECHRMNYVSWSIALMIACCTSNGLVNIRPSTMPGQIRWWYVRRI